MYRYFTDCWQKFSLSISLQKLFIQKIVYDSRWSYSQRNKNNNLTIKKKTLFIHSDGSYTSVDVEQPIKLKVHWTQRREN